MRSVIRTEPDQRACSQNPTTSRTWHQVRKISERGEVGTKHRAHLTVGWDSHVINDLDHYHVHDRGETRGGINLRTETSRFEVYGTR